MKGIIGLCALTLASGAASAQGLRLYEVGGANNNANDVIWHVDTTTPTVLNPLIRDSANAIAEFEWGQGAYYAASTNINTDLFVINPITGVTSPTITMSFPSGGDVITSMEFVGATLYGGFTSEGGGGPSSLVTINTSTGVVSMVGAMGITSPTGGLAWDGATMYTVNSGAGGAATLYTVALGTGAATAVGNVTNTATGAAVVLTGLEFGTDGILYGLGRGADERTLFSINPANGDATSLGSLPIGSGSYTSLTTVPAPGAMTLLALGGLAAARRRH